MFNIGDYVAYKRDICVIKSIKEKYIKERDYYVLNPIDDDSLIIHIPKDDLKLVRKLITKEEVDKIIKQIPDIPIIELNDKMIENEYKNLLYSENHIDLIKIIKTTYLRNKAKIDNNKKVGEKDNYYFEKAERYLYNEFSIVLNKTIEETKQYIIDKLNNIN